MKKILFLACLCAIAAACTKESGTDISGLSITPESYTVYTDEALPELVLSAEPAEALDGETVTWTSSNPDVISVNSEGVLAFEVDDIEETEMKVTITASVAGGDFSANAVITVKGQIARYGIIDLTSELGIRMLDRNLGAGSPDDPGYYYQWGKNEPVTPETIDADWTASGEGFSDWTSAGNSPCPAGWELIDAELLNTIDKNVTEVIFDYEMCLDMGFPEFSNYTEEEYNVSRATFDKFGLVPGGCIRAGETSMVDENGIYNSSAVYVWAGVAGTGTGTAKAIEYSNNPNVSDNLSVAYAYNLRCVKKNAE